MKTQVSRLISTQFRCYGMAHDMESEPVDAAQLEQEVDDLFERTDARAHAIMSKILEIVRSQVIID